MVFDILTSDDKTGSNGQRVESAPATEREKGSEIDLKAARTAIKITSGAFLLYAGYKIGLAIAVSFIATPAAGAASLAIP